MATLTHNQTGYLRVRILLKVIILRVIHILLNNILTYSLTTSYMTDNRADQPTCQAAKPNDVRPQYFCLSHIELVWKCWQDVLMC